MSEDLHRLIYISDNKIQGSDSEIHQTINQILLQAQKANTAAGITGALMFNTGCFAQVLEGHQEAIEETFERIQCDRRHDNVVILSFDNISSRAFGNWSMAYVGQNSDSLAEYAAIKMESGFDSSKIPVNRVFEILQEHLLDAEKNRIGKVA